ncbi:autotransporter outer membrane beta-barrel domain-containing protein [Oceanicaulis sp. MMSF_3324]|uniref:autotransporter family protein n=1 Tax=Oceanicaulis sp. MMSF_3324 TaxID=3046702 RepID=UPI00273E6FBE|nr:autotransporter outer membrane beta-barrel domain-containing protein [Oceanicaulis sp. MMSF_3324]
MRRSLLAAVSLSALIAAPAWADEEINDERTEPVETADADGAGNADNIVIGSNGRVTLVGTPGPAVRVNSNHDLTTETGSTINILDRDSDGNFVDVDGAVGVQVDSGVDSDITHAGRILLDDSQDAVDSGTDDLTDTDGDGQADDPDTEADGAFAQDQNKTGILLGEVDSDFAPVDGQAPITGDINITSTGSVVVQGQNSFGVRAVTAIDGDFLSRGSVNVTGENSRGVSIESDVSGDVEVRSVTATSPGGEGFVVEGDVGGGIRANGSVQATGYRTTRRFSGTLMALFESEAEAAERGDVADNLDSGSAFVVAGSVTDGVFISATGIIQAYTGSGAGLEIRPDEGADSDVVIGEVSLPDDYTADRTDDDDDGDQLGYAVVNEGRIANNGIFDGKDATAFLIVGRNDNGELRSVILGQNGISNADTIQAIAYDGTATAVRLGEGVQAESFHNTGTVQASASLGASEDGFADDAFGAAVAIALDLDENSQLRRLLNEAGTITATVTGGGQSAVAIRSNDDSLEEIHNTGVINASAINLTDAFSQDDIQTIAIDARNNNTGLQIIQDQAFDDDGEPLGTPLIRGDILLGDGDDRVEINAGSIDGDIAFGLGADTLVINNASLNGAISDADGDLVLDVANGQIGLTGSDALALRDAIFRNDGVLEVVIDTEGRSNAFLNATGDVTFEEGSALSVGLANVIGQGGTFNIITAGTLTIANEDETLTTSDSPYLYNASLERSSEDANKIVLTLELKTAEELGMHANQAAAYDEALAAFQSVESLGAAFANLRTAEQFYGAYDQLLPEYAASAIQFALASNDAAAGALQGRLRNARLAPDNLAGVWIQEFGYFADRSSTAFGAGYRGQGVGLAVGLDRPVGPFYAVGVQLVGAASEIEESDGFDQPMISMSGQVGGYAAMDLGGFDISGNIGIGYDYFETDREIRIGDFTALTTADWTGWHATASFQAGRDFAFGNWVLRPEADLTYVTLFESGYTETTAGTNADAISDLGLVVDDRDSSILLGSGTLSLARRFGTDQSWWAPSIRVGYRGEFSSSGGETTAQFGQTGNPFTLRSEQLANSGALIGFGLSAGSDYSTFTFAYDADVRDDFVRHVARLVIRLTF